MNAEHKRELDLEEAQEEREEPMYIWISDNLLSLEEEFIKTFPPEEQPLDDDTSDFLDVYCDDFDKFCRDKYFEVN